MIVQTRQGRTDTRTGEIVGPKPRFVTKQAKRQQLAHDLTLALAVYSLGATVVIAMLTT